MESRTFYLKTFLFNIFLSNINIKGVINRKLFFLLNFHNFLGVGGKTKRINLIFSVPKSVIICDVHENNNIFAPNYC